MSEPAALPGRILFGLIAILDAHLKIRQMERPDQHDQPDLSLFASTDAFSGPDP
jgi:hypothetical protein